MRLHKTYKYIKCNLLLTVPKDAPSAVGCASSLGRESGVGGDIVTGDTSCDTHIAKTNKGRGLLRRGGVEIEGMEKWEAPDIQGGAVGGKRCLEQMRSEGQNSSSCVRVCVCARKGAPCVP